MSNFRLQNGDDYPDAARKNLQDAEVLFQQKRYDGAAYLAGYVVECVLKTLICYEALKQHGGARPIITHNLSQLSTKVAGLITAGSPNITRYTSKISHLFQPDGPIPYGNPPAGWSETLRYRPENTIQQTTAKKWFDIGKEMYEKVVEEMRKDGIVR